MRILYVADGRSPIAVNWMRHFVKSGREIHLISTYPCQPGLDLASIHILPVAFGGRARSKQGKVREAGRYGLLRRLTTPGFRTAFRQWLGPLTLTRWGKPMCEIITNLQPDIIHAMRIPFEGMVAAAALSGKLGGNHRLLISVWGNDFTLHARSTPFMAKYTQLALTRADALHTDCHRDLRLARERGFNPNKPAVVLPGGGGVQRDVFFPRDQPPDIKSESGNDLSPLVINPRGFRAYVHNETFFKAIPPILKQSPKTRFLCPAMQQETDARRWIHELNIEHAVELLPHVPRREMAELFRRSQVAVSPTSHDGTPNTLLEAMACGCFPIAGDIESLREWIEPGVNGLLVNPTDSHALANAILRVLSDHELREQAATRNITLVKERADYSQVMEKAENFYREIL